MPTSDPKIITPVCEAIKIINPKKALDIGVGFGKWGALIREYTDIWNWRFYESEYQTEIHGIEPFEKYHESPNYRHYDQVYKETIWENLVTSSHSYNLIIMMEVLEHLPKDEGFKVLEWLLERTDHLIFSYSNIHQKNVRDNPLEDHVSKWELEDFDRYDAHKDILFKDSDCAVLLITSKKFNENV